MLWFLTVLFHVLKDFTISFSLDVMFFGTQKLKTAYKIKVAKVLITAILKNT